MPAVTRIGDADVAHCSGMTRAVGSPNVFANSIAIHRLGDATAGHGSWVPNAAATGSGNVFANEGGTTSNFVATQAPLIILSPEVAAVVNTSIASAIATPAAVGNTGGVSASGQVESGQVPDLYEQTPDATGVDTFFESQSTA